jgi:hypothetical protein
LSRFNEESDEDELSIQAEDHYADLGDGLVLETEEKSSSAYRYSVLLWPVCFVLFAGATFPHGPHLRRANRKSSEFASGELDEREDLLDSAQGLTYRLIHAKELRIQRHPIGRGVFGVVYSAGAHSLASVRCSMSQRI